MTHEPAIHVVGRGIVGRRLGRMLAGRSVIVHDPHWSDVTGVTAGDVVILVQGGDHSPMVPGLLRRGLHVVTVGDSVDDARELLSIDPHARDAGVTLVVGAAMSPGLSDLVARHLARQLDSVDEIHIAVHGTAGPSCARSHHRSLSGMSLGWHDGEWTEYVGGSGRELCWFPEPIGAKDCYRARLVSPVLLHRGFPDVGRISVRRSARRRDRLTAWLPMLRPPHPEGGTGGLRVEVRGADGNGARQCLIAGVAELVGTAAAATAAAFAGALLDRTLAPGVVTASDPAIDVDAMLRRVESFGVRLQEFTGVPQPS